MDTTQPPDDLFPGRGDFRMPLETSIGHRSTDEAIDLLCSGGVAQLTLNTLAKAALYSPSRFHTRVGGRAGMIVMLVGHFADRWQRRVCSPLSYERDFAWLPDSPGAVDGVRAWHAIVELALGEARAGREEAAEIIADIQREELEFLRIAGSRWIGRPLGDEEGLMLQTSLHGLRAGMAAPTDPVALGEARAALSRLLTALGGPPLSSSRPEQNE